VSTFTIAATSLLTSSGGRTLLGEQPPLSAPLEPAPTLTPAPILGPAILRPFLPNSPEVYVSGPAIIAPIRPTGYPTVTTGGLGTEPAPAIVQAPAPVNPQRPRVLPGPSTPLPTPVTVQQPHVEPGAPSTPAAPLLEQLKRVPWWGVAAALVLGAAVLFSPHPATAG
jgi:hypothetical protein